MAYSKSPRQRYILKVEFNGCKEFGFCGRPPKEAGKRLIREISRRFSLAASVAFRTALPRFLLAAVFWGQVRLLFWARILRLVPRRNTRAHCKVWQ
jgi:hypothetical protein